MIKNILLILALAVPVNALELNKSFISKDSTTTFTAPFTIENDLRVNGTTHLEGPATLESSMTITGASASLLLDSSGGSSTLGIDRAVDSDRMTLNFLTGGVSNWHLGLSDDGVAGDGTQFFIGINPAGNSPALWIETGNQEVGIKTTSPQTNLDVNGDASFGAGATKSTFSTAGALQLVHNANCAIAPASRVGQFCAQNNARLPIWVATTTGEGFDFTPFELAATSVLISTEAPIGSSIAVNSQAYTIILTTGVTTKASPVRLICMAAIRNASGATRIYSMAIFENSTQVSGEMQRSAANNDSGSISIETTFTPTAAHHVYTCQVRSDGTGTTQKVSTRVLSISQH